MSNILEFASFYYQYTKVYNHLPIIRPFSVVYYFTKNNQRWSRWDYEETNTSIRDNLDRLNVNYGILMFTEGMIVFCEEKVDLNPTLFKLATGINYTGQVLDKNELLNSVNEFLKRN